MGRAARWLRGLLGGKRAAAGDAKPEKRKWGFVKSFREKETAAAPPAGREERRGSYREVVGDEAQSKRAIEVAAATAAVAEAAVAAAQAAAVVVKLTSCSGWSAVGFGGGRRGEEWGAVKIQAAFRGYLARRALRALRGLVKLQALVRGNIVRKQAAETLRCMHALVRVQARARACRAIRSERGNHNKPSRSHPGPPTPETHEPPRSISFKRSSSKGTSGDSERAQSSGWNWLDRWMEERYWDSRESATKVMMEDEKNAKILEIDNGKPKRRTNNNQHYPQSSCSTVTSDRNSRSFATVVDSPSVDSSAAQHCVPSPSSVDKQQQPLSPLGFPILIEAGEYIGESPQFFSASSRPGSSRRGPFTPAKSDCARSLFSAYPDYPNYMSYTESSRAKVRSQSAPRQRPDFDKSGSLKRMSAPGAAPSQKTSSSSMQVKFANKAYPGSGRLDRLGMPIRY